MRDGFKSAVTEALKELFETKHLFQSVQVKTEQLLMPVPKKKRIPKQLPPVVRALRSVINDFPVREAKLDNLFIGLDFSRSWHLGGPAISTDSWPIIAPKLQMSCAHCKSLKALHLSRKGSEQNAQHVLDAKSADEKPIQVFAISYQCQHCETEPVIFFVKRVGLKLTLIGRSQFEPISVPHSIPNAIANYYHDAMVAFKTGHCLAALFFLRTLIEQHMRKTVQPISRITGEELADEYQKQLSPDFPKKFRSLKLLYQELSAAMHEAREDDALYVSTVSHVEKHFEAVRLFSKH